MTGTDRARVAASAGEALERARPRPAIVGFDGFIDSIIHAVDVRRSMRPDDYAPIRAIEAFAARCAAAAGRSANIELVTRERRFGGNGPLLAGALARLGFPTTFVGCVGREDRPDLVHPLYDELDARCRRSGGEVLPVAPPASTLALEFADGKLMLGDPSNLAGATWPAILERLGGLEGARRRFADAELVGLVNWVMMPSVDEILARMSTEILPGLPAIPGRDRHVLIDLCDPAKRTDADLARAFGLLASMDRVPGVRVTLGMNLAESVRAARVLGVETPSTGLTALARLASGLRERIGVACVAVHPREGAAGADAAGSAWFAGPFVREPALSTGAGDHFNAGLAAGRVLGRPIGECLALGCAVSGLYVRRASSPSRAEVVEFLRAMPEPEPARGS